jgi:hypothetical protein
MGAFIHVVVAMAVTALPVAGQDVSIAPYPAAAWLGDRGFWRGAMDLRQLAAAETVELAASDHGSVVLGAGPIRVPLSPSSGAGALAQHVSALGPLDQVYLVLEGIDTDVAPGISYNVFLGLPDSGSALGPADPHYVGTLSFFDSGPSRSAAFNVTGKIKALSDAGALDGRPTVTLIPAGTPDREAKPTIGRLVLMVAPP